jgi:hypothetical protein
MLREDDTKAMIVIVRVRRSFMALAVVYSEPLFSFNGKADTTNDNEREMMQHSLTRADMMLLS